MFAPLSKVLLATCFVLPLAACQTNVRPPLRPTPFNNVTPPTVQPLVMERFQWKVYNLEDLKKLVAQLEREGVKDFVVVALTPEGYKALGNNMLEIQRYIQEQQQVILFLQKVISDRSKQPNA